MVSRTVFTQEMKTLNQEMIQMGNLAEKMIKTGTKAFVEGDAKYLEEMKKLDRELHFMDQTIEKHCLDIIALHQPLAVDLRTVSSILKIITDLNRIGRYGRDLAETGDPDKSKHVPQALITMISEVLSLVSDAIRSFVTRDIELAKSISNRDDTIDELWKQTLKESLDYVRSLSSEMNDFKDQAIKFRSSVQKMSQDILDTIDNSEVFNLINEDDEEE